MAGGHRVDPEVLASAARDVKEYPADQLANPMRALEQLELNAADFGRAAEHQEKFGPFKTGMKNVVESVQSYVTASESYAKKLTDAGSAYSAHEQQAAEGVHNAGSA